MLNSKQRAFLRSHGHNLPSMVQIGKDGVNENTIKSIEDYFVRHELIKINILKSSEVDDLSILADNLAKEVNADIVSKIGRKIILYRFNKDLFDKGESYNLPR